MKTQEELNALKEEVETLNKKLAELTDEELEQVNGSKRLSDTCPKCGGKLVPHFYLLLCKSCNSFFPFI